MSKGTSLSELRRLALALPGTFEQDHHGRPSFRVEGRIYATVWDAAHINVMLEEPRIRSLVQGAPGTYGKGWWGGRLRCVRVDLRLVKPPHVGELLRESWERYRRTM
jgi:hypothetical protein